MTYGAQPRWILDHRYSLVTAALVWTLVVLMIVPEGLDYRGLITGLAGPAAGSMLSRVLWIGLLAGATAVVVWRSSLALLLLRSMNPWLLIFALLAVASIFWSINPVLTLRRDIRLLTILMVALAFALSAWHPLRLQTLIRPLLTLVLIGSIVFGLVAPQLAIHQETSPELFGAWRGLSNHKNTFGALACITFLLWLHGGLAREVSWLRAVSGCTLAAVCVLLSNSATSLLAMLATSAMLLVLMCSPRDWRPLAACVVALLAAFLLLYSLALVRIIPGLGLLLAPVTALTGIDTSFTNRRDIWNIISAHAQLHPVLGTGYGAYWAGPTPDSPSYQFILRMGQFYPGSAHNGHLEILNDLGWVGLLCALAYIFSFLTQALRLFGAERSQGALYLVLLIQQSIANLSESHWLNVLSLSFVLMTLATASQGRLVLERRLRTYFGHPVTVRTAPIHATQLRAMQGVALAPRA